ncbi:hypothetical protein GF323_02650 [Candidatus Woesearchaeota archaeon]|nr:hypothetical protein [Candidatus Woesearchaeota archaeon]
MKAETLEHKVLGPGNFADNVAEFERWDSIAEIQARRAGTPLDKLEPETNPETMQRQWYYGSDAPAYSMRKGRHTLEIYDFNDKDIFQDKSESVRTIRAQGYQLAKLSDLEDKTRTINLSDKKFNRFVTRDNSYYSHITYELADVKKGIKHFKRKYGAEATKLFTAKHGEDVYSEEGVKGRFREGQETANIYFQNQSVTESRLAGQEEGTKVLRGAYLLRHGDGSVVGLDGRFIDGGALVSGVVRKSGEAGTKQIDVQPQKPEYTNQGILDHLAKNPVTDPKLAAGLLSAANTFYQSHQK